MPQTYMMLYVNYSSIKKNTGWIKQKIIRLVTHRGKEVKWMDGRNRDRYFSECNFFNSFPLKSC